MATSSDKNENNPALDPDQDSPSDPAHELAQFGAGCFWGVELTFQRVVGVVKTEVGYSQGHTPDPDYKLVCSGSTNHVEVVRVEFDPKVCPYTHLLSVFWGRHDPTTINRQVPPFLLLYADSVIFSLPFFSLITSRLCMYPPSDYVLSKLPLYVYEF